MEYPIFAYFFQTFSKFPPVSEFLRFEGRELNTNFLFQTFRAPPGYPGQNLGISRQKVGFLGFRRTYRSFWPPPLHVGEAQPTRRYPDQKVWVWAPFSSLRFFCSVDGQGFCNASVHHRSYEQRPVWMSVMSCLRMIGLSSLTSRPQYLKLDALLGLTLRSVHTVT